MDRVKIIFARLRLPTFSIKHPEAFQVMSCLPIPQPSTLVGALGYCIGVYNRTGINVTKEKITTWIENGELLAARARLYMQGKIAFPAVISPIILRRFRIVDKAHEKKTKEPKPIDMLYAALAADNYIKVKQLVEIKLMDAFYRDYIMGHEILCSWAFREGVEISDAPFWLMQRLGDTESLISVIEVWSEHHPIKYSSSTVTSFPVEAEDIKVERGDFLLTKMCDEKRVLKQYLVPIRYEIKRVKSGRVILMTPTEVHVEFTRPISYCESDEGIIIFRRGV